MGVNIIGSNMLPNIGVKIGTKATFNLGTLGYMNALGQPHLLAFPRGMTSSSAKLDPVQVSRKESETNLTIYWVL